MRIHRCNLALSSPIFLTFEVLLNQNRRLEGSHVLAKRSTVYFQARNMDLSSSDTQLLSVSLTVLAKIMEIYVHFL